MLANSLVAQETRAYRSDSSNDTKIDLYFFWSETCPHCNKAKPFVYGLADANPWIRLHSLQVDNHAENRSLFVEMARSLGQKRLAVPAFIFCETIVLGYGGDATTGKLLQEKLLYCRDGILPSASTESLPIDIPFLGELNPSDLSLPIFTLIIAGVDAFNPCAFFILLFLLSLLVHAKSRARMFLVGGIFVLVSGLVYFVFMAAWLNVFILTGEIRAITMVAGVLVVVISLLNIKEFFFFREGVSLSIPESVKPGLFQRMRRIMLSSSKISLITGTAFFAIAANAYELLCTAGFPMVYTRVLTMSDLSTSEYYLYLFAYNLIYIVPLLLIVLAFTVTLGSRKLTEREGRILKLLSGVMMLFLGILLLVAPEWLSHVWTALLLPGLAVLLTVVTLKIEARWKRKPEP